MRSIFGKCTAIAMMAAIALAWQSPPAYAEHQLVAAEEAAVIQAEKDARANAAKADAAVAAAKEAATQAEKDAVAAEEAATEAETAVAAAKEAGASTDDQNAAIRAATAAREAAADARKRSGREKADLSTKDKPASVAKDKTTAWSQVRTAEDSAGMEKYETGENEGKTIPFLTGDHPKEKVANNTDDSVWSNYRETQFQSYALEAEVEKHPPSEEAAVEAAGKTKSLLEEKVETARDEAQKLGREAGTFSTYARSQADIAERIAVTTTAAAVTKAKADLEKAQAEYDEDASFDNLEARDEARQTLKDAEAAAAKAAEAAGTSTTPPGDDDDDDDDDTAMMGDTMVTANGVGNLLKFGSWTTTQGRDTLLAVTNPGNAQAMVTVAIKNGMGMPVETFTICLTAGDVWTAALMAADMQSSTMMIGSPGMCDGSTANSPTDMLPLNANHGFIEAYTDMGGMLTGIANVVDAIGGYSSISNAVSLVNFDSDSEAKMADVRAALAMEGDIRKDMLIGRWSATPSNGAMTHVVLTFPAGGGPGTTPVRIHVYDESGMNGSRTFTLSRAVNLCTFITVDGLTTLSCNGGSPLPLSSDQGWFKIMDPMGMGFPVIGTVTTVYNGSNGMFDQTAPIQWMEDMDATADTAN